MENMIDEEAEIEVDFGDDADEEYEGDLTGLSPDDFFAKYAKRVIYQTNHFFLPQIRSMIADGEAINLQPEYQRRLRWTTKQKSLLIESLLLNIPIPAVYFYESDLARYEVMDGQQRLSAIASFFNNEFKLSGLTVLAPLNGLNFKNCPPRVSRALERASISAIVVLLESAPDEGAQKLDLRRLVFDRLNTGGRPLNKQEIRNALNPGNYNDLLIEASRNRLFTDAFGIPPYVLSDVDEEYKDPKRQQNALYKKMGDIELVLRFFALRDSEKIKGSMQSILDEAMKTKISEEEKAIYMRLFSTSIKFLHDVFGKRLFRLPPNKSGKARTSAALFDSFMVAADKLGSRHEDILKGDIAAIHSRLDEAFSDEDELALLTGKANTADAVKARLKLAQNILLAT